MLAKSDKWSFYIEIQYRDSFILYQIFTIFKQSFFYSIRLRSLRSSKTDSFYFYFRHVRIVQSTSNFVCWFLETVRCIGTKCLKNQPYNVIKMGEMRGEVGKKTPKKDVDNPSLLWRHMADFLDTLSPYQLGTIRFLNGDA